MFAPGARAALDAIRKGATAADLESEVLDFKTQGRSVPDTLKDLAQAAACFANARGGTLVVGVVDNGSGPEALVGCSLDPVLLQRRIYEITDPALIVDVESLEIGGRRLVLIHVPSSPDVHAVGGRSTERVGLSCHPMSTSRIAVLVAERRGDDWSAHDSGVVIGEANRTALDVARAFLEQSSDPQRRAYARETDEDLLRRLGLVTPSSTLTNGEARPPTPALRGRS